MALSLRCLAQASKSAAQIVSPTFQVPKTPKTPKTPRTPKTTMPAVHQSQGYGQTFLAEDATRAPGSPDQRSVRFEQQECFLSSNKQKSSELPLQRSSRADLTSDTAVPTPSVAECRPGLPVLLGRLRLGGDEGPETADGQDSQDSAVAAQRAFLARQARRASRAQGEFVV
mmetsp:Transcript_19341/g.43791  ORF Transcript_19341/g.43791 Transcript_19341/m.43791 type:complete len:171 (+) Transcript_19341:88-600(+)